MSINDTSQVRNLGAFTGAGYDKGRGVLGQIAWLAADSLIVRHWWCPVRIRIAILRIFGAKIGRGVLIRHNVRIHWPWKLTIGDNSWIGERAWLLNLEPIVIGQNVCISQDVLLCTGSHNRKSPSFEFDNAPIEIADGAWIAARATVLRGVCVGRNAVVGATALITVDIKPDAIVLAPRASVN